MDKTATKKLTIDLRKNGYSYNLISQKTGVSKSTLSNWLSEFPYTPNRETIDRIGKARAASSLSKSKIKLQSFAEAFAVAKKDIDTLSKRDLFMLGLGVYIGEGTKDGHIIRIINSDPRVIKLSIK
jgi:transcriptional regulator with XRE-family HTH domain